MSGWDVSSTPKWGPQEEPEDSHAFTGEDFGAQDFGRGGPGSPADGFPDAGGPPPEFFGQDQEAGQTAFPQRTPGGSFRDLPRRESRGRHSSAPGGGYGQDDGFAPENGFPADNGFGRPNGFGADAGYGQEPAFGQDNGFGHGNDFPPENGFGQESGFPPDGGFGRDGGFGQDNNGSGRDGHFGRDGAFAQGQGQGWGGGGGGAGGQADGWGPDGQDSDGGWGRPAGRSAAPWDEQPQQGAGYPDQDGPGFGQQDFGRQDYPRQAAPGFTAHDYGGQEFPGQQEGGPRDFGRGDRDMAARMDPALQDFFSPGRGGGSGGYPGQGPGEPNSRFRRPPTDGWEIPGRPAGPRGGTGPRPAPRGTGPRPAPRGEDPEPRRGLGTRGLIGIGVVVAVIIVVAVVLVTHKSGGGSPTASGTASGGATTTSAAKPSAGKSAKAGAGTSGGAATAAAFALSTPSTAGGYPMGTDPNFLSQATATAKQVTTAVSSGGGGTVKGTPVSAAYRLPASQVITFVGYAGTFTPAKVETILASLGSDPHTYPAGTNGGVLGCANTTTTPSGAVCVWATTSTLGVTEFFTATGPETLVTAQSKGAADAVKLRADVEKKK